MSDQNESLDNVGLISQVSVKLEDTLENSDSKRYCWVCFATEEDDQEAEWVQPCQCRGTTKWVHQSCLQRWIDEKQRGNSLTKVSCPQCNTEYLLVFPPFGTLVYVLDAADRVLYRVCPLVAAGVVVGSVYWTAVTYGAITVMQVLGYKEGLNAMEQVDPLFLLVGLPTIPIMLILGKMVRWEDYILRLWRRHSSKIPGLKYFFNCITNESTYQEHPTVEQPPFSDPVSATRILCGALLLPTMATIFGKVFFSHVPSNPHRIFLGGMAFVAMKGVFKIYLRQQQYIRQCQRRILNYSEHPVPTEASRVEVIGSSS